MSVSEYVRDTCICVCFISNSGSFLSKSSYLRQFPALKSHSHIPDTEMWMRFRSISCYVPLLYVTLDTPDTPFSSILKQIFYYSKEFLRTEWHEIWKHSSSSHQDKIFYENQKLKQLEILPSIWP